jgi:exopolyphosphatase / guanosine-5'-triphosphate,3'-diphosphate pyrophosphatase
MDPAPDDAVAALDCGTNSTRLLISTPGKPEVRLMRITRLGQGVDATKRLDRDAIERTLAVLRDYRKLMDRHGVVRARLVATSAVRDAANGDDFISAASEVAGVPAELLDGDAEGALAFAGATASLDLPPAEVVIIDIGGGSTELVTWSGQIQGISLDLGCVRLTERFLLHDPPQRGELAAATAFVQGELDRAAQAVPALLRAGLSLVGLAGTVSTLAALAQALPHYDRDRLHHYVLDAATVTAWLDRLAAEPAARRGERVGMTEGRQDVIVGGALVLQQAMARLSFDRCLFSESDILDGLAASLRAH